LTRKSVIAVVDDDEHVLYSLENLLESYGYAVRPYGSAVAFLADDARFDVDCLISDVSMPVIDGFQLQQRVGEERPQLPVILITARPDVNANNAELPDNRCLLQKPFDSIALLDAIASATLDPLHR
jgi:FixJ family two-component response regulator